jgi:hypothetical protein
VTAHNRGISLICVEGWSVGFSGSKDPKSYIHSVYFMR